MVENWELPLSSQPQNIFWCCWGLPQRHLLAGTDWPAPTRELGVCHQDAGGDDARRGSSLSPGTAFTWLIPEGPPRKHSKASEKEKEIPAFPFRGGLFPLGVCWWWFDPLKVREIDYFDWLYNSIGIGVTCSEQITMQVITVHSRAKEFCPVENVNTSSQILIWTICSILLAPCQWMSERKSLTCVYFLFVWGPRFYLS